ncbi:MAG: transglutaminase domain-containing protein [Polaribacter sp.]|uniref:transglutaminase domain-containing protein n=1 Tax=Polaribacter sp. TaxID=1920175 RepID=UPI003265EE71
MKNILQNIRITLVAAFFLLITLIGCNIKEDNKLDSALKFAKENKTELQKVLDHYQSPKDSLKLKAAKFLITNMPYHSWLDYGEEYDEVFNKTSELRKLVIKNLKKEDKLLYETSEFKDITGYRKIKKISIKIANETSKQFFEEVEKVNNFNRSNFKTKFDVREIKSKFLIDNIDLAFDVYNKDSLRLCNDFETFLNFVLPYRVLKEPVEINKRKEIYEEFKWARDSLKNKSLDDVIQEIFYRLRLAPTVSLNKFRYNFPVQPSITHIENTRFGTCEYLCTYFVSVLRSIGIPSSIDYSKRWGNHHNGSVHSWVMYFDGNDFKSFNVGSANGIGRGNQREFYQKVCITKVFRNSFDKSNEIDVTDKYHSTADIEIDVLWNPKNKKQNQIYLGVFNPTSGWDKITAANNLENSKLLFKNVGVDLIYVAFYEDSGEKKLINYPFELSKEGALNYLDLNDSLLNDVAISRKFPIITYLNGSKKIQWKKEFKNFVLQGRKNENSSYEDIFYIKSFNSSHQIDFKFDPVLYKNYRFYSLKNKWSSIATFNLLDSSFNEIKTDKLSLDFKWHKGKPDKLIDNNPVSYVKGPNLEIKYNFDKKTTVSGFRIQARNDDNHINKDENYELLYWDRKWISLGNQRANDTVLYYKNVPKNALYWLKNHTKGKEEYVFKLNENGKQVWVGATE